MPLCWIDIETSGLDPNRDHILEVACVITDGSLREVARWEHITYYEESEVLSRVDASNERAVLEASELTGVNPYVIRMHLENGLWAASAKEITRVYGPPTPCVGRRGLPDQVCSADEQLSDFIKAHCPQTGEKIGPQLAGSSVHFDRSFLKVDMPLTHALLHYRHLDTTSINELARRVWLDAYSGRPAQDGVAHRAMPDIQYSLGVARYYAAALSSVERTESEP